MRGDARFQTAPGFLPLVVLPVKINGKGIYKFILDTGASVSYISPALAKEHAITPQITKNAEAFGNAVPIEFSKMNKVTVGQYLKDDLEVGIIDMAALSKTVGVKVDGTLGYNYFKDACININFNTQLLVFDTAPAKLKYPVPFRLASDDKPLIIISVNINGKGPFDFALHTGVSITTVCADLAHEIGLPKTAVVNPNLPPLTQVDSIQVGERKVKNVQITNEGYFPAFNEASGTSIRGFLGYNFFKNFSFIIDYIDKTLYFVK
jgi:Aspartyl protease